MDYLYKALYEAVVAELRAERGASKITFDQLELRTGISKRALLRYINGERDIPLSSLFEIAEGIGLSIEDLLARAQLRAKQATKNNVTPIGNPKTIDDLDIISKEEEAEIRKLPFAATRGELESEQ